MFERLLVRRMCQVRSPPLHPITSTDNCIDAVPEFISQRRRWLNGAFFAAVYSLLHFKQIWTTDHTVARKILLHIETVYQAIQLVFTFFSLVSEAARVAKMRTNQIPRPTSTLHSISSPALSQTPNLIRSVTVLAKSSSSSSATLVSC